MVGLKFRLSNMIPIAWFYKLKHMNKSKNQNLNKHPYSTSSSSTSSSIPTNSSSLSSTLSSSSSSSLSVPQHTHRTSQYFKRDLPTPLTFPDTQFMDSPRKCSRRRGSARVSSPRPNSTSKKNPVTQTDDFKSLIMKDSIFGKSLDLELPPTVTVKKPRFKTEKETKTHDGTSSKTMNWSVRRLYVPITPTHDHKSLILKDSIFGKSLDLQLPPIATKKKPRLKTETRHGTSSEQGKKNKKKNKGRRSRSRVLESLAVVKLSVNPQTDFMESIVEMIVENDIKGSKDLEDLLACYLQLNSDEHHELIIKVFKQIWFRVAETRLKMKY